MGFCIRVCVGAPRHGQQRGRTFGVRRGWDPCNLGPIAPPADQDYQDCKTTHTPPSTKISCVVLPPPPPTQITKMTRHLARTLNGGGGDQITRNLGSGEGFSVSGGAW